MRDRTYVHCQRGALFSAALLLVCAGGCDPERAGEQPRFARAESALQIPSTCGRYDQVTTSGSGFQCNRQDFSFVGVNARELVYAWNLGFNKPGNDAARAARIVYDQLQQASMMGATVIRVYLPRQERPLNGDQAAFHKYFADQLRYLMDFATEPGPFSDEGIDDYREYRVDASGRALPAPAPNMKFLVVLHDYIYACSRAPWGNMILSTDAPAFADGMGLCPEGGGREEYYLRPDWFQRGGASPNYTENYLPFVRAIAKAFYADPRIFGFEVGNEMKAGSLSDMKSFLSDTVCAIKGVGCTRFDRELSAQDRDRLVGTGFLSSWHAAGGAASPADAARELYKRTGVDFGSIHQYDDATMERQADDIDFFKGSSNRTPYIVGELGYNYTDISRQSLVSSALVRLFDQSGADGVLPWGFYGSDDPLIRDVFSHPAGQDTGKSDWSDLFAVYACRAVYLDNLNAGRLPRRESWVDVALVRLGWQPDADPTVGETVRLKAHVCNAGNTPASLGMGVAFYLDNNGVNPQILAKLGSVFDAPDLGPHEVRSIDLDWTVVAPGQLNPAITPDNAVLVALADDINRYPAELTEENNGYAIRFPIQPSTANKVPKILNTPKASRYAVTNGYYVHGVEASDEDNDPLIYALPQAPPGMQITEAGRVTWDPVASGAHDVTLRVSDGQAQSEESYQITTLVADGTVKFSTPVTIGGTLTKTFGIYNGGGGYLNITAVNLSAGDTDVFTIVSDGCTGASLPGSNGSIQCYISVAFTPTTRGSRSAIILIENSSSIPAFRVGLVGEGVTGLSGSGVDPGPLVKFGISAH